MATDITNVNQIKAIPAMTSGKMIKADSNGLPIDATNTDAEVSDAVSKAHTRSHTINSTSDHTSSIAENSGIVADANGLPKQSAHITENATGVGIDVASPTLPFVISGRILIQGKTSGAGNGGGGFWSSKNTSPTGLLTYMGRGGNAEEWAGVYNNGKWMFKCTDAGAVTTNAGLHVGGDSDPGDNNLLVDGDTTVSSLASASAKIAEVSTTGKINISSAISSSDVSSAVSNSHARSHAINSTSDHTSSIAENSGIVADANGLPKQSAHIAENATGVAIGHTSPRTKLDVKGEAQYRSQYGSTHDFTDYFDEDVFLRLAPDPISMSTYPQIVGVNVSSGAPGLSVTGLIDATSLPTDAQDTSKLTGAVQIAGAKRSGTAAAALGNAEPIINVKNLDTVKAQVLGDGTIVGPKIKLTAEGGYAILLKNKTGSASVAGQIVSADTGTDNSFYTTPANGDMPIGVVYNAGVADGSDAWVVVSGMANVLFKDTIAPTRGYQAFVSSTAGRSDQSATSTTKKIGQVLETKSSGTDIIAKCIICIGG